MALAAPAHHESLKTRIPQPSKPRMNPSLGACSAVIGWRPLARFCGIFILAFYLGCFYETLQLECSFQQTQPADQSFRSWNSDSKSDSSPTHNSPFPYSIHSIHEKDQLYQQLRLPKLTGRSLQELSASSSSDPLLIVPTIQSRSNSTSRAQQNGVKDVKSLLQDCSTVRLWIANEPDWEDSCLTLVAQHTYETNQVFGASGFDAKTTRTIDTRQNNNHHNLVHHGQQHFRPHLFPQFAQSFSTIQAELASIVASFPGKQELLRLVLVLDEKEEEDAHDNSKEQQFLLLSNWLCAGTASQQSTLIVCLSSSLCCQRIQNLVQQQYSHNDHLRVWQPTSQLFLVQDKPSPMLQQAVVFYTVLQAGYSFELLEYSRTIPTDETPVSHISGDMQFTVSFENPPKDDDHDNTAPPVVFAPWRVRGDWMHVKSNVRTKHAFHRWLIQNLLFEREDTNPSARTKMDYLADLSNILWEEASLFGLKIEVNQQPAGVSIADKGLQGTRGISLAKDHWQAVGKWYLDENGQCRKSK